MSAFTCPECGCKEIIIRQAGSERTGVYCRDCFKWLAWVNSADIRKIRAQTQFTENQAPKTFRKMKGRMIMRCGNCKTLLYDSSKPKPEGQFNLIDAKYCPYCGKELV